jgi:CheY-like chemotaxis protein
MPGKGSVFWFEVEFDTGMPESQVERLPATAIESGEDNKLAAERSPLRILVAEDHPVSRRLVLHMLEKLGYSADIATNGREAVDLWEQRNHDVIIMDCQMPEMDGFEATQKIRNLQAVRQGEGCPSVKIIALTANALLGERQRCLAAGMDDYITKPLRLQALRSVLGIPPKRVARKSSDSGIHLTPQIADLVHRIGPKAAAGLMKLFLEDTAQRLVELRRIALLYTGSGSHSRGCDSQVACSAAEGSGTGAAPLDHAPVDHLKALAVGAHGLAGGCGLFGLERMRELGLGLEAMAVKLGNIPSMVAKLEEEFSSLRSNLLQEITYLQGVADSQRTRKGG